MVIVQVLQHQQQLIVPLVSTTFTPGLTREVDPTAGPTFQGGAGFTSQNWLTLPKGTTTERDSLMVVWRARGIFQGGTSNKHKYKNMLNIATSGNAVDFGD